MYQNQNMNPNMNPNPQYAYGGMPYGTAPGQFYNPSPDPTVIGGYTYGGRPAIKATQPITPELMKFLHQHNDELDLHVSDMEKVCNWCTHKEPGTNRVAVVRQAPDSNVVTCRICGETFEIVPDLEARAAATAKDLKNIIQTIKLEYLDCPEEFLKSYSQMLSLADILTKLAARAERNYGMYEAYTGGVYNTTPGVNAFQAASNIINGSAFNMFGGAPTGYPGYGYAPAPGYYPNNGGCYPNGYYPNQQAPGYGAPVQNGQPVAGGFPQPSGSSPVIDQNGNVMAGGQTIPGQAIPMGSGPNFFVNNGPIPGMAQQQPNIGAVPPAPTPGAVPTATQTTSVPIMSNDVQQTKVVSV